MSRTITSDLSRKVETLKRRRDFLSLRVADYKGKDNSRDKAEESAIDFAIEVIEAHYEQAYDILLKHRHIEESK